MMCEGCLSPVVSVKLLWVWCDIYKGHIHTNELIILQEVAEFNCRTCLVLRNKMLYVAHYVSTSAAVSYFYTSAGCWPGDVSLNGMGQLPLRNVKLFCIFVSCCPGEGTPDPPSLQIRGQRVTHKLRNTTQSFTRPNIPKTTVYSGFPSCRNTLYTFTFFSFERN